MDVEMMGVADLEIFPEAKMSSISAMDEVYWEI